MVALLEAARSYARRRPQDRVSCDGVGVLLAVGVRECRLTPLGLKGVDFDADQ